MGVGRVENNSTGLNGRSAMSRISVVPFASADAERQKLLDAPPFIKRIHHGPQIRTDCIYRFR